VEKSSLIPLKIPIHLPAIESVEIVLSAVGKVGTDVATEVVVSVGETIFVDVQDAKINEASKTMMIDFVFIFPFAMQGTAQPFASSSPRVIFPRVNFPSGDMSLRIRWGVDCGWEHHPLPKSHFLA
jgi:hypothetical protein